MGITESWDRVTGWCWGEAPLTYAAIRPSAGAEALQQAMAARGRAWPAELQEWFALHDGVDLSSHAELLMAHLPMGLDFVAANRTSDDHRLPGERVFTLMPLRVRTLCWLAVGILRYPPVVADRASWR